MEIIATTVVISYLKYCNGNVFFLLRTSLFIICSGLYAILLVVICATLLAAEIATNHVPLHYFEVREKTFQTCSTKLQDTKERKKNSGEDKTH